MGAGGQSSFQVGQTAKARSGYRVQSLRKGHGRQRFSSEELTNHSPSADQDWDNVFNLARVLWPAM
jgi:hypothetical protein